MSVFLRLTCACGYNQQATKIPKTAPLCPRCRDRMRHNGNWYIAWTESGKKQTRVVGPRRDQAVVELAKVKTNIAEGRSRLNRVPKTPWETMRKDFLAWAKTNVAPKTEAMYASCLRRLDECFEKYTLDRITPQMVEEYKAQRSPHVSPATINRELATIKRLFSLAVEWNKLESDPLGSVKKLTEGQGRERYLTEAEVGSLLAECDKAKNPEVLRLVVLVALNTGLRKGDVLGMRWRDIDLAGGTLRRLTEKTKKMANIPLTDVLQAALKAYQKAQKVVPMDGLLFPSLRYHPTRPLRVDGNIGFEAAVKRAGIEDFRFHDLRHTFATWFLMRTGDIVTLQDLLGHSDPKLTRRYAHIVEEHKRAQMAKFSLGG